MNRRSAPARAGRGTPEPDNSMNEAELPLPFEVIHPQITQIALNNLRNLWICPILDTVSTTAL